VAQKLSKVGRPRNESRATGFPCAGKDKPFQTKLSEREYDEILALVEEFKRRKPRNVLA
jgi:hypothetical protein